MEIANKTNDTKFSADLLGSIASGVCALHCALTAFLPSLFAILGVTFLVGHEAEWGFTLVAVGFALGAMFLGWQQLRSPQSAALFAVGIIGLLSARFLEEIEGHEGHGDEVEHAEKSGQVEGKKNSEEENHREEGEHGEHHELGLGIVVGLGSGALLVFSHFKNASAIRRTEDDCCETPA